MRGGPGALLALVALAACGGGALPEIVSSQPGLVVIRTNGDLATAEARAKLECGEPERGPGLLKLEADVATYRCM